MKITAPISLSQVARTIGCGSADVGTVCTHFGIKKYSLIQPTFTTNPTLRVSDFANYSVSGSYNGIKPQSYRDVGFGWLVPKFNGQLSSLITHSAFITDKWTHCNPNNGSIANYKCLAHFDGYNHYDEEPTFIPIPTAEIRSDAYPVIVLDWKTQDNSIVGFSSMELFCKQDADGRAFHPGVALFVNDTLHAYGVGESFFNLKKSSATNLFFKFPKVAQDESAHYKVVPFVVNLANYNLPGAWKPLTGVTNIQEVTAEKIATQIPPYSPMPNFDFYSMNVSSVATIKLGALAYGKIFLTKKATNTVNVRIVVYNNNDNEDVTMYQVGAMQLNYLDKTKSIDSTPADELPYGQSIEVFNGDIDISGHSGNVGFNIVGTSANSSVYITFENKAGARTKIDINIPSAII